MGKWDFRKMGFEENGIWGKWDLRKMTFGGKKNLEIGILGNRNF